MTKGELVTVAELSDRTIAHIIQQMLIANGIAAEVIGEVSSYPCFNSVSAVKVVVNPEDKEAALTLIEESRETETDES